MRLDEIGFKSILVGYPAVLGLWGRIFGVQEASTVICFGLFHALGCYMAVYICLLDNAPRSLLKNFRARFQCARSRDVKTAVSKPPLSSLAILENYILQRSSVGLGKIFWDYKTT